jgi:hypothetical protein
MRRILGFYESKNQQDSYTFNEIVNTWSDYKLQVNNNYINWLYPMKDDTETKLTVGLLYKFKTNPVLRNKVIKATFRMMLFFGYKINKFDVVEIKPIFRDENHIVIGFYNPNNFPKITRILNFLSIIDMQAMSCLFFLMICKAMKDPKFNYLVKEKNILPEWLKTQTYLTTTQRHDAETKLFGEELAEWELYEDTSKPITEKLNVWGIPVNDSKPILDSWELYENELV